MVVEELAVRSMVVGPARCLLALMNRRHRLFVTGLDLERFGFPVDLEEGVVEEDQREALLDPMSVWRAWEVVREELRCRIGEIGPGAVLSRTFVKERRISSEKFCMSGVECARYRS